jgi:Rrf2 family protein
MIGLTTKTIYGIAALYQLSSCEQHKTLKIKDIACKANVPQKFLEQILLELKKKGFLQSKKGAYGGYKLAIALQDITLKDIILTLENDAFSDVCKTNNSVLKLFWTDIQSDINDTFDVPLSELKKYEEKANQIVDFSI